MREPLQRWCMSDYDGLKKTDTPPREGDMVDYFEHVADRAALLAEIERLKSLVLDHQRCSREAVAVFDASEAKLLAEIERLKAMVAFRDNFIRERYRQAFADCFPELPLPIAELKGDGA